jgi:hypothetical protein
VSHAAGAEMPCCRRASATRAPIMSENAGICQNLRECAGMPIAAELLHCTRW